MGDLEVMINADVQKRLSAMKCCVPRLTVKCIHAKSVIKDTSGVEF